MGRHARHRVLEVQIFPGLVFILNQICLDRVHFQSVDKDIQNQIVETIEHKTSMLPMIFDAGDGWAWYLYPF